MNLNCVSIDKNIIDKINAPIPAEIIKEREGAGKKMLSYVSGQTVIDMLNHAFNYCWSWTVDREWITESIPYFNQYRKDGTDVFNGKTGAWEDQGPVAHVLGTLTIMLSDENGVIIPIKKQGYGSKSILGKQNDQESIFKAAGTDALKKAASLFGICLELYRDENEQEYFNSLNDPWTDVMRITYESELSYIAELIETGAIPDDAFIGLVSEFSCGSLTNGLADIVPANIVEFANWLKNYEESKKG